MNITVSETIAVSENFVAAFVFPVTDPRRICAIELDLRVLAIPHDSRTLAIEFDDRTLAIPHDNRTYGVEKK